MRWFVTHVIGKGLLSEGNQRGNKQAVETVASPNRLLFRRLIVCRMLQVFRMGQAFHVRVFAGHLILYVIIPGYPCKAPERIRPLVYTGTILCVCSRYARTRCYCASFVFSATDHHGNCTTRGTACSNTGCDARGATCESASA